MTKFRLEIDLTGFSEQRGESLWAAVSNEFGYTTYGTTEDEARSRMLHAVSMTVNRLADKGGDVLHDRFSRMGVPYLLELDNAEPVLRRKFEFAERRLLTAV